MSFAEQERVLFDLLFDPAVRQRFVNDADSLLEQYDLESHERDDFKTIRPEALALDANMRVGLLLSSFNHSYPVSFSLVSSLPQGNDLLKSLVDAETMHTPPLQRATVYGSRLRDKLAITPIDKESERPLLTAIVEAELGMAYTAAMLKQSVIEHGPMPINNTITADWDKQPVKLADFVSAAMLPQPYAQLKLQLCPKTDCDLWTQLTKKPLAAARKTRVLQKQDAHLLVARANLVHASQCEPAIEHITVELSEGFAHLFQHINGQNSVEQLLAAFKNAGATEPLLQSVKSGFKQLVEKRMLMLC